MVILGRFVITVLLSAFPFWQAPAATPVSAEYRLKAAFGYEFVHFVDWPAAAWDDALTAQVCEPSRTCSAPNAHSSSAANR